MHCCFRCSGCYRFVSSGQRSHTRENQNYRMDWACVHFCSLLVTTYVNRFQMLTSKSLVMIAIIAVGVQDRPPSAPQTGPWTSDYKVVSSPSFVNGITAISSLVFAYSGTPGESNSVFAFVGISRCPYRLGILIKINTFALLRMPRANSRDLGFFPIAAEMRDPSQYTRSLLICQGFLTAIYITVGTVMYYYCGSFVASPALGSAGTLIKRIAYGISLPGLIVSTILVLHVSNQSRLIPAL